MSALSPTDNGRDFAKLYHHETHGQILVLLNDEEVRVYLTVPMEGLCHTIMIFDREADAIECFTGFDEQAAYDVVESSLDALLMAQNGGVH